MGIRIITDSIRRRGLRRAAGIAAAARALVSEAVTTVAVTTVAVTTVAVTTVAAVAVAAATVAAATATAESGVYQTPDSFVDRVFQNDAPDAQALWLRGATRETVSEILGRPPAPRIRYWRRGERTAWVLDEVGKEQPITAGVVVEAGAIREMHVLVFRESRGWEVRYPFFTRQFEAARLTNAGNLDQPIDGITGATLSVRAMTRMARVALLLDAHARGDARPVAAAL